MSPTLAEVQAMFPRCPVCGLRTAHFPNGLIVVEHGASQRVAHFYCATRDTLETNGPV